jgi:hypothetical protein
MRGISRQAEVLLASQKDFAPSSQFLSLLFS